MSRVVSRGPCDKCGSSDANHHYDDGHSYCHKCKTSNFSKGKQMYQPSTVKKDTDISLYQSLPIRALTHKPISKEICEKYGVRVSVDESTGQVSKVYYPYLNQSGELTAYKVRGLPKDFHAVGTFDKIQLFGQHLFNAGGKMLVITEGEDDALAAAEMFLSKGKSYSVVSVPDGANDGGRLSKHVFQNMDYIKSFENVVICFDNDKPGQSYAKTLADEIVGECKVKIMNLPLKDAGDMLKEGLADEFWECLRKSQDYTPELIVRGSEITLEQLMTPKQPGYPIPYDELNNKLHGIRKGEITLFCAGSGIGKSTIVKEIAYHLCVKHNLTIGNIFLETAMEDAARGYIALDNNVSPGRLNYNPAIISKEDYNNSYQKIIASNRMHFFKHFGSLAADKLLNKALYMVKVLGVDFIILDHISMVIAGEESSNERKDIDMLMERLVKLVVETGVGVIAVVHLKRVPGKNYNTGDEVELTDLRGSAGLEQMSWSVVALERDQQGDSKDFSKIRVLKNRTWGFTGLCDTLQYHHDTGRLLPAQIGDYQ